MKVFRIELILVITASILIKSSEHRSLVTPPTGIRSDVIVTGGFKQTSQDASLGLEEPKQDEPGRMRRQLLRFGEMTGIVGNKLGGFAKRLSSALDKICQVVKTIIPVMAAVCHVGQFEFCGDLNAAPQELAAAFSPENLDLSIQD